MKKSVSGVSDNFGFVDGNVMSAFEAGDALRAMMRSIEKLSKNQIIAALQGFGYEPEGGFARTSKKLLAKELFYKKVVGTKMTIIFGHGYSN